MALDPTYDEAQKCPQCRTRGQKIVRNAAGGHTRPGTVVETWQCDNVTCEDELGTRRWIIQVNPDGSVPIRAPKGPKQFELDKQALDWGKAQVEQTKHSVLTDDELTERNDLKRHGTAEELKEWDQEHGLEAR